MAPKKIIAALSVLAIGTTALAQPTAPNAGVPVPESHGLQLRPKAAPKTPNLIQRAQPAQSARTLIVRELYADLSQVPDIDPGFNINTPDPKPQPHWEKREFNGEEYFHVPIPAPSKARAGDTQ